MKEQALIEIKNKVETLGKVLNSVMIDIRNVRDLAVGTLETMKNMSEYNDAIEKLKADLITKQEEKKLEIDVE